MRLPNPLKSVSLRWRLTLLSTLVAGAVFILLTATAYLTIRNLGELLYAPIYDSLEQNMKLLSDANRITMFKTGQMILRTNNYEQLSPVHFILLDKNGKPSLGNQAIPISDSLFQQVMSATNEQQTTDIIMMPNGSRVMVVLSPVDLLRSGEVTRMGVLVAAARLDLFDQAIPQVTNQVRTYLVLGAIAFLLIVAGGTYIVSGRALRPVTNVIKQVRNIETSRDLSQRIRRPGTDDEIGNLVETFNQMLGRLEMAFAAQRRFVADSSHELRTPITVIRGNLHLMRKTNDPAERKELINITEGEVSRLNRMVNDLLYIAQMQAGHDLKPVLRSVELDSLLLDVFALARSMSALKDQRVLLVHEDIATVFGDREQLQHLLLNLIDNAVKYTPEHGLITLGVWTEEGWARIEVGDTGPGVSEEDVPLLFDRFFRSQQARVAARDGAGLGLSIVKSITEAHNGRVEVFSKLGEGTTFRVWLPMGAGALERWNVETLSEPSDSETFQRSNAPEPALERSEGFQRIREET